MYTVCFFGQVLMKIEFSWQIFECYTYIRFYENCQVGAELFHEDVHTARRTDG